MLTERNDKQITGMLMQENQLKKVIIRVDAAEDCVKITEIDHTGSILLLQYIVVEDQCQFNEKMIFVRQLNRNVVVQFLVDNFL